MGPRNRLLKWIERQKAAAANSSSAASKDDVLNVGAHIAGQLDNLYARVKAQAQLTAAADSKSEQKQQQQLLIIEQSELSGMKRLTAGHFGDIFVSRWQGRDVVLKRPKTQDVTVLKELAAFFKLPRHDRICPLLAACLEPDLLFVSPLLPHGSLKQLLDNSREKKLSATEQKAIGECALMFHL